MVVVGIGIQDMAALIRTSWVETTITKVILVELEWYRYHGHKYK
jgi:hypothetical protein